MGVPVHLASEAIDWPAWVQAIGSVIAIFVAIGVAHWQLERARRDKRAELEAYCWSVAVLAGECLSIIQAEAKIMLTERHPYRHDSPNFEGLALADQALASFDPSRLSSAGGALSLFRMRACAGKLRAFHAAVVDDVKQHGDVSPDTEESVTNWQREAEVAHAALRKLAELTTAGH